MHRLQLGPPGWAIAVAATVLVALGVACIHVTDTAYVAGHDGPANARKQMIIFAASLAVGWAILRVGYREIAQFSYPLFIAALILLIPPALARLTHSSFGGLIPQRNGAWRWIRLPFFQLQPSEIMKIALILALAWYLRFRDNYRRFRGLLVPLAASTVPLFLILLEPDLGTCLLILPLLMIMFFIAGAKVSHLSALTLMGLLLAIPAWTKIHDYQRRRITAVLFQYEPLRQAVIENEKKYEFLATRRDAIEWRRNSGYQLLMSKNAIGSGGWSGYGWGEGPFVEYGLLPDRHNDFIFALIAHQWGMRGCLAVLLAYAVIVLAGAHIASATKEPIGRLLATGITVLIGLQVLINTGMTLGLLPITGMTLPLVSQGGCSLLMNMVALSLLISVSHHKPFLLAPQPFDFSIRRRMRPVAHAPGSVPKRLPPPAANGVPEKDEASV